MFTPDPKTRKMTGFLLEIIDAAEKESKKTGIEGGFGVEIEAANLRKDENLTRNHNDIDLRVMEEDISFWREWFIKKNFTIGTNEQIKDQTKAFAAFSPNSEFYVDVYGVKIDENGNLSSHETGEEDNWNTTWDELFIPCRWKGHRIFVMNHHTALKLKRETASHLEKALREVDIHDIKLFES